MMKPHVNVNLIRKSDIEQEVNPDFEKNGLYLVSVNADASSENASGEVDRIRFLEEKVRQLNQDLSRLTSLLFQKEQLLRNFRIREQELKASLFQTSSEAKGRILAM